MTDKNKNLYSVNWIGDGWNHVFANSKEEAVSEIIRKFPSGRLKPNLGTLQLVTDTEAYWNRTRWID